MVTQYTRLVLLSLRPALFSINGYEICISYIAIKPQFIRPSHTLLMWEMIDMNMSFSGGGKYVSGIILPSLLFLRVNCMNVVGFPIFIIFPLIENISSLRQRKSPGGGWWTCLYYIFITLDLEELEPGNKLTALTRSSLFLLVNNPPRPSVPYYVLTPKY